MFETFGLKSHILLQFVHSLITRNIVIFLPGWTPAAEQGDRIQRWAFQASLLPAPAAAS